ncbi:hypothetical protein ACFLSH_01340 [Bacteroidota bacterium]
MKTFIILLVLGAAGYYGYTEYFNPFGSVEITGNIQVSQQGNFDINAPQLGGDLYMATIHGKAKNTSNKPLKNVFINYKIAGISTSAMIFDLGPQQQLDFTTKGVKTRGKNPPYFLENVKFEENE